MFRVESTLNVSDVEIERPPVRRSAVVGTRNHPGPDVESSDEVTAWFAAEDLATATEEGSACCWTTQDKVGIYDPDGAPREIYPILTDREQVLSAELRTVDPDVADSRPPQLPGLAPVRWLRRPTLDDAVLSLLAILQHRGCSPSTG